MDGLFWMGNAEGEWQNAQLKQDLQFSREQTQSVKSELDEVKRRVARLALLNQALWELLRDKMGISDADLEQKATEIDLRDGVQDGAITAVPVKCPACGRTSSSKNQRCMYCGQALR